MLDRRTITVGEWAQVFGISRNSAYKAAREGQIPGVIRIGERYVIPRSTVEAMLGEKLDTEQQAGAA